jgi:peptide/nickel transport system permease protein
MMFELVEQITFALAIFVFGISFLALARAFGTERIVVKVYRGLNRRGQSPAARYFKRDIRAKVGLAIVLVIVFTAIFASFVAPHDPIRGISEDRFQGASWNYPMGTDYDGRCIFSRVIYGTRIALAIGALLVAVEVLIGVPLGLLAGYRGGKVDSLIMRMVDAVLAMPGLIIALAFVAIFGPGLYKVVLAMAVTGWAGYARLMRGQTLAIKEEPYIEAARAIGEKDRTILRRYVLPNSMSPLIVMVTMTFPAAILLSSSMSFLGLGIMPPEPDWGAMLNQYSRYLGDPMPAPLWSIFPGIVMIITILGFNFLGDALRDALDPRLRE